jgi:hypothetical protein
MPGQQSSGGCLVRGKRIDPGELSEITLHDVDIVEVWRRGLVLRAAQFVGQATSTGRPIPAQDRYGWDQRLCRYCAGKAPASRRPL